VSTIRVKVAKQSSDKGGGKVCINFRVKKKSLLEENKNWLTSLLKPANQRSGWLL
jgi:hypothetical protein